MTIGPFAVILLALVLVALAYVIDLFVRRFWRTALPARLSVLAPLLGVGLWLIASFALAQQIAQTDPQLIAGLVATAPSIVLSLLLIWVIWGRKKNRD